MKKTKSILAVLLCAMTLFTVVSSCSKESTTGSTSENTNESTNERKIIGKWITTNEVKYTYDGEGNLISTENGHVGDVYEFKSDGTASENGWLFVKYSIVGDELVLGEGNATFSYRIVELTNSAMIWEDQTEPIHGWGINEGYYSVYRTVLEKQ